MNFKLRPYQEECVQKGLEILTDKKGRREVIIAATSSGKSLIIGEIAKRLPEGKVLVLSPNVEILEQNLSKINSFGVFPSVYSASANKKQTSEKLIYGTPKSITYEVFKELDIKYVIVDECDHATKPDSEMVTLLKKLKVNSVLGLTGSAIYMENTIDGSVPRIMTQVKNSFFTDICKVVDINFMVANGFWSDIQYYDVFDASKQEILKLNKSGSEFLEESQKSFYEACDLKKKIADFLSRLPEGEDALVFVPDIFSAEELQKEIPNSVLVHSKMNKKLRKEHVEGFKNNTYRVMINVGTLLVGFDKDTMTNIVDASASNSIRIYIQKIGRIVRKHKDKKLGRIVDFAGNYQRHGHVHDLNYDYIEGYGWGLFRGDVLITDVPLNSGKVFTKECLRNGGKVNLEYTFGEHNKGDCKLPFGAYKNHTVKELYYRKRHYLKYLYDSGFTHEDKELERQINSIFKT